MTRPITTAHADTARAMHAAEMRGHDMQDAPKYVTRFIPQFSAGKSVKRDEVLSANQLNLITEAECQRRIDAAVTAEIANASVMFEQTVADLVKALKSADTYIDIGHYEMARNITRNAIRARGQK